MNEIDIDRYILKKRIDILFDSPHNENPTKRSRSQQAQKALANMNVGLSDYINEEDMCMF